MATSSSAHRDKRYRFSSSDIRIANGSRPPLRGTPASSPLKSQTVPQKASDIEKNTSSGHVLSYSEAARKAPKQNHGSQDPIHDKIEESLAETEYWTPSPSPQATRSAPRSASKRLAPHNSTTEDVFTSPMSARIPRSLSEIMDRGNQRQARRNVSADTSIHHQDTSSMRDLSTVPPAPISILDFVDSLVDDGVGGTISRSTSLTTIDGGTTLSATTSARSFSNFGASRAVSCASTFATEMYSDHDATPTTVRIAEPNFEDFQAGLTPQKGFSGSASSPINSLRKSGHGERIVAMQGYTSVSGPPVDEVATSPRKGRWPDASIDDSAIVAAYLDEECDESFQYHNASFEVEDQSFYASAETSMVMPSTDTSFHGLVTGIEDFGGVLGEMELLDESETGESSDSSASDNTDEEEDKENRPVTRAQLPSFFETARSPSDRFDGNAHAPATSPITFERLLPHERTPLSLLHSSVDTRASIWNTNRGNGSRDMESSSGDEAAMTNEANDRYRQALASKYLPDNSWSPELDESEMEKLQLHLPAPSTPPGLGSTSFDRLNFVQADKDGLATAPISPALVLKAPPGVIGSHLRCSRGASGATPALYRLESVEPTHGPPSTAAESRFSPFDYDDVITAHASQSGGDLVGLGICVPSVNPSPSPFAHISERGPHATIPASGTYAHINAEEACDLDIVGRKTTTKEHHITEEGDKEDNLGDEALEGAFVHLSTISSLAAQRSRNMRRVSQEPSPRLPVILEVSSPPISVQASVHAGGVTGGSPDWRGSFPSAPCTDHPPSRAAPPDASTIKTCGLFLPLPFEDPDDPQFIPDWWYGPTGAKDGGPLTSLSGGLSSLWKLIPNAICKSDGEYIRPSLAQLGLAKEMGEPEARLHGYDEPLPIESVSIRSKPEAASTILPRAPSATIHRSAKISSVATVSHAHAGAPSGSSYVAQQFVNPGHATLTADIGPIASPTWNVNASQGSIYATNRESSAYTVNPAATYIVPGSGNPQPVSITRTPLTAPSAMIDHTFDPQAVRAAPPPYSRHQPPTTCISGIASNMSQPRPRVQQFMPHTPLQRQQQQQLAHFANAPFARAPTPAAFLHQHHQQSQQQQHQQQLYPGPRLPAGMIQHAQLRRGGSGNHPPRMR
ncbi:hypothetical protein FRB94_003456 [Tulasnella sp. JGI-2019a]|nr:hypothetical protein FRB94_003456 [Tulasnella sp. JGI-2019a]